MNRTTRRTTAVAATAALLLGAAGTTSTGAPDPGHQAHRPSGGLVDPTAAGFGPVELGRGVYVAPFAEAIKGHQISVGAASDVQDNVLLDASRGPIRLGDQVILAHNAAVTGKTEIGESGNCPGGAASCPSFVGFNAVLDGAVVEQDAMVLTMARVATGVRIPSGVKVLPGRYVRTQAEVAAKSQPLTEADRAFMAGVIEVNTQFAEQYPHIEAEDHDNVRGVSINPETTFTPRRHLPTFVGRPVSDPRFDSRIIGEVEFADSLGQVRQRMDDDVSVRADEGNPFLVGTLDDVQSHVTAHALESSEIILGDHQKLGYHSVVHGGGPRGPESTHTGDRFTLGDYSAFFRAQAGDDVTIGDRSLVQGTRLPDGTRVPDCTVIVDGVTHALEWCTVPFPEAHGRA